MAIITRCGKFSQAGFTLLETLVVIVLIGILTGVTLFSVRGSGEQQLQAEAERLIQSLQFVSNESVLHGYDTGVVLTHNSYAFVRYDYEAHMWKYLTDRAMREHLLPSAIQISLILDKPVVLLAVIDNKPPAPVLIFSSSGEIQPFTLSLSLLAGHHIMQVKSDGVSPLAIQKGVVP